MRDIKPVRSAGTAATFNHCEEVTTMDTQDEKQDQDQENLGIDGEPDRLSSTEDTVRRLDPVDSHEVSGQAEMVRVDPPPDAGSPVPVWVTRPAQGWRPVIPVWLRSWRDMRAAMWWVIRFVCHTAAFHFARLPLYAAKLAAYSPRGAGRSVLGAGRWLVDSEAHPLRMSAVDHDEPEVYLKLVKERRLRVRLRFALIAAAATVSLTGILLLTNLTPQWTQWLFFGGIVGLLGWLGVPADKPIIGPAVIAYKAQRLTSDVIVRALGALGLAEINKVVKNGGGITFPAPITRDGPGWRADIDLPFGVTVTDIIDRRERLASGLRRPLGCVWPEPASNEHAGRLVLWVGDEDMNQTRPHPWPLASGGRADIFAPLPFGQDPRGRLVCVLLMFSSVLIGAMTRAGKSFALRVVLLGCALDPRVQLRVFDFKGTGDHAALEKIAHHYASGAATPAALEACMGSLRQLVNVELPRRAKVIENLPRDLCPENKITPELASRASLGLCPVVIGIDECQELFSHPDYSSEAEALCLRLIKQGAALGVLLILATQRPDRDSLPTGMSANAGIRFCLRVMGQVENDMILGTSAYKNGLRATQFTQRDKGIGYLIGAGDDPQIVKTAYLDAPAAEKITARAYALRAAAGTLTGHAVGTNDLASDTTPTVSLLDDVVAVTRSDEPKIWLETLAARLAELRPDTYGAWASADGETRARALSAALKPYGVTTTQVWAATPTGKGANRRGLLRADLHTTHQQRQQDRDRRPGPTGPPASRPPR